MGYVTQRLSVREAKLLYETESTSMNINLDISCCFVRKKKGGKKSNES